MLIPFTHFESEVLVIINVATSQITPNSWDFIRAFEIICWCIEANPVIHILFSFYGTKKTPKGGWMTLRTLLGRVLFTPYSNHYKTWEDGFVRLNGRNCASKVTIGDENAYFPPLY